MSDYKKPRIVYKIEYIYNHIIDQYLHVDTTKSIKLFEHDNKVNFMYEPFSYRKLSLLFKKYPFKETDGFIDIGCGKGRVLIQALLYGCRNIYGVDISKELIECANNNMQRCQSKIAPFNYQLLCMNAKDYSFSANINKVFLFNPFNYKIFLKVIKALIRSIMEKPREVMLFVAGTTDILKYMAGIKEFRLIAIEQRSVYVYEYISPNEDIYKSNII